MGSTASVSCRGDGDICGTVGVSDTLLYPPTPTHTHPPDLPATEGIHVHIPFLIMLQLALIGPPLGLPATTKPIVWVGRWIGPLPTCRHVFLLFFFFVRRVEEGAWKRGED